jgi:L-alanine-DL-glutamate epimerase-like enolase superfamily enzyme
MKIKKVIGYGLSSPFQASTYLGYLNNSGLKNIGIVEVHTDNGLVGFGETYAGVYCAELIESNVKYLEKHLIGMEVSDPKKIFNKIFSIPYVGRNGLLASINSAINTAVYDILGKYHNKPVYELLSISPKKSIKTYASNGSSTYSPSQIKEDVLSIKDKGFDSYKMRIGYQSLDIDLKRVETAKNYLGEGNLMIDSIMGTLTPPWDLKKALSISELLEPYNPYWFEEPVHPTNIDAMKELTSVSPIDIAGGEALNNLFEFTQYSNQRAVNTIQPDVTHAGGFDECFKICSMFPKAAMHVWGSGLAVASNLHFSLACDNVEYLEIPMMKLDITDEILNIDLSINEGGYISAPNTPGIGINITENIKKKYKLVTDSNYVI